jgi:hypothetical protein
MSSPRFPLSCIFALALVASISAAAQSVTTWHNDNNRTGWQQNETTLTPTSVTQSNFGLLWQWTVAGQTYAQPLAVANVSNLGNLVFVATEQDMLYAFNANSVSQVWSTNLAAQVPGTYSYVNCANLTPPCMNGSPIYPSIGVTGTPVISTAANTIANVLYVVTGVQNTSPGQQEDVRYYLHAIDITTGAEKLGSPLQIMPTAAGVAPLAACAAAVGSGTLTFDPHYHIQRTGLLLLTIDGVDYVYVGFAPVFLNEMENGWIVSYSYTPSVGLAPANAFVTTPYGTGGGVWEAGAGLASDGTYIYAPTGNGTFDVNVGSPAGTNYGDSLVKLDASSLTEVDYSTPPDWNSRCINNDDLDFGSGGVLLFPDSFFQNHPHLMVSADKESYLWVVDRDSLGEVGGQLEQTLQPSAPPQGHEPGYWSSPAYWKYSDQNGTHYQLYYAADEQKLSLAPWPLNMYALNTSGSYGPILNNPTASTATLFCRDQHAPTPSISSNGTAGSSGLVWAIEGSNHSNPVPGNCSGAVGPAVLHAYSTVPTSGILGQVYTSGGLSTSVGHAVNFPVPTVFNGKVYMGTLSEVDVFGPCAASSTGCLP